MAGRRQQIGRRRLLGWALMSLPLFSACGTKDVPKPPGQIATPLNEVESLREVERVSVKSSNLQSVGYDESSRKLTVEFRNGSVYEYGGVPPEIHAELMNAKSHGKYFHSHIRNAGYTTSRVH